MKMMKYASLLSIVSYVPWILSEQTYFFPTVVLDDTKSVCSYVVSLVTSSTSSINGKE